MRISRKLHSIREEIAPPPQVEFRLHCLRGSRLGSQRRFFLFDRIEAFLI